MSDAFVWKPEYSVGVDVLDDQHRRLFEIVNRAYDAVKHRNVAPITHELLKQLVEYTEYHFRTEEALMKKGRFPEYEAHMQIHLKLTNNIKTFQRRVLNGELKLDSEILEFLQEWLVVHICEEDKRYAPYVVR